MIKLYNKNFNYNIKSYIVNKLYNKKIIWKYKSHYNKSFL